MSHEEMLPGEGLSLDKMPGHWLLARMGKRVLRPGGIELTRQMIAALGIKNTDHVVEFAPGLGITAQLALAQTPATYTGVEADESAAQQVQALLSGSDHRRCVVGRAENTGLADGSATVIYGEAMLTMQTPPTKPALFRKHGGCSSRAGVMASMNCASFPMRSTRRSRMKSIRRSPK